MRQDAFRQIRRSLSIAFSAEVLRRSIWIAVAVGTTLNLINQGNAILHGFVGLDTPKFLLNFLVPYLVASYSAVATALRGEGRN